MDSKKLMYIGGGIVGFVVVLIVIILIIDGVNSKKFTYEKLENQLVESTQSYLNNNASILPKDEGKSVSIDANTLSYNGYMKNLSEISKDETCTGKVVVTKNGDRYLYTPILNCGQNYITKTLVDVVKQNNPIVFSGDGLYTEGISLKFKGEFVNNYVMINENLWRILSIDSEGYVRLIFVDKNKLDKTVWDNRYNIDTNKYEGINNYSLSRIKTYLDNLEKGSKLFAESDKTKLAYRDICVGPRSEDNKDLNIDEECKTVVRDRLISLPYVIDYMTTSVDSNCKSLGSASCSNYNYLSNMGLTSWTLTASKDNTNKAYSVFENEFTLSAMTVYIAQLLAHLSTRQFYQNSF